MIRTAAMPQRLFIALFVFLAAVAFAVAPLPLMLRSVGVVLCAYLAFSTAGMPAAYLTALLAPPLGLIRGDQELQLTRREFDLLAHLALVRVEQVPAQEQAERRLLLAGRPGVVGDPQLLRLGTDHRGELVAVLGPQFPGGARVFATLIAVLARLPDGGDGQERMRV